MKTVVQWNLFNADTKGAELSFRIIEEELTFVEVILFPSARGKRKVFFWWEEFFS